MRNIWLLLPILLVGCVTTQTPRTLVEMSETDPKTGIITNLKVSLEKELTADDLAVTLSKKNGFSLAARHIETRNVGIINADTGHLAAVGTAAGNVIGGLGSAVGQAGAMIIGTEGLNAASAGLGQLIGTKMTLDAATQAAAAKAAAQAAGAVK
jgi:hypothetical protein